MSITDIVSGMDRSFFTQIALVLFIAAFTVVVIRLFAPGHRGLHQSLARLPLDEEDTPANPSTNPIAPATSQGTVHAPHA